VLADEPIASLDPRNAARVMESLKAINCEDGITILCNLHTIDAARQYSDRIVGMANGRVVFDGTPAELTSAAMREIYQIGEQERDVAEEITSTTGWLSPEPALAAAPA
jgi:phosphonate transport system ATP-binding protein